jgi:hypothetical protein
VHCGKVDHWETVSNKDFEVLNKYL